MAGMAVDTESLTYVPSQLANMLAFLLPSCP